MKDQSEPDLFLQKERMFRYKGYVKLFVLAFLGILMAVERYTGWFSAG